MIKLKNNITEDELVAKILNDFRIAKEQQKRNAEIMSKKTFNYGDVVIKKNMKGLDCMFGLYDNVIGVIVGSYELEGKKDDEVLGNSINPDINSKTMYRVHYSEYNSYVGQYEGDIELYEGEIPDKLRNVTWNNTYYGGIRV